MHALRRIGASNRNVSKISFKDQVVYQENIIVFHVYRSNLETRISYILNNGVGTLDTPIL